MNGWGQLWYKWLHEVSMKSFEYDLRFLEAGAEQLEVYLLSTELYWPPGVNAQAGEPPYPQFTLGALLLARQRARATAGSYNQQTALNRVESQIESVRGRWRVAWGKKAAADFQARLNLWRDFLDEYRKDPEANSDRYTYEVNRRVQLELLSAQIDDISPAQDEFLTGLDLRLRTLLEPAGFIWPPELVDSFPSSTYWYLYGRLPAQPAYAG